MWGFCESGWWGGSDRDSCRRWGHTSCEHVCVCGVGWDLSTREHVSQVWGNTENFLRHVTVEGTLWLLGIL